MLHGAGPGVAVDSEDPPPNGPSSARRSSVKTPVRFETPEGDEHKKQKYFNGGCLSCETGMNAPGIRHNKACRQAQAEAHSGPEVFQHDNSAPGDGFSQRTAFQGQKRSSETAVEDLEQEIKASVDEDGDTKMDMIASIGLFWSDGGDPLRFPTLSNLHSYTPPTLLTSLSNPSSFCKNMSQSLRRFSYVALMCYFGRLTRYWMTLLWFYWIRIWLVLG